MKNPRGIGFCIIIIIIIGILVVEAEDILKVVIQDALELIVCQQ